MVVEGEGVREVFLMATLKGITHWKNYSWRAHVRAGEAEGDPEGDGRRTLANGWESRLWRLEDKHLREGSSVMQFGRPRPLRIRHTRRSGGRGEWGRITCIQSNDPTLLKTELNFLYPKTGSIMVV